MSMALSLEYISHTEPCFSLRMLVEGYFYNAFHVKTIKAAINGTLGGS